MYSLKSSRCSSSSTLMTKMPFALPGRRSCRVAFCWLTDFANGRSALLITTSSPGPRLPMIFGQYAWASSMLIVDSMTASSAHTHPHAEAADSENSLTHPNVTGGLGLSDDFHRYVPGSWFFCAARDSLHVGQQVSELAVVDFDPVVKIEADPLVGIVAQLLV